MNHKGFKLTKQGSSSIQVGWKQVTVDDEAVSQEHHLFTREGKVSCVSHVVTLHHPIAAKITEIRGTTAFAISGTPADCTSFGISKALFPGEPGRFMKLIYNI
nr:phosphoglycerate mutase-like protein AT74H [Tanacetum cinerariifolium]